MNFNKEKMNKIINNLEFVYGEEKGGRIFESVQHLIESYKGKTKPKSKQWVDEKDVMLITYGDTIKSEEKNPLQTLNSFLKERVGDTINSIHILPFYPFTSDDGFSVQDYLKVNPEIGNWEDVHELSEQFDLMFDAVINHISSKSDWFLNYLEGDPDYQDYFVEADPDEDYSSIVRPRALPLLTKVEHAEGTKYVWTTFSEDQIDLNFESEKLFMEVLDILAQYIKHGARYLRLDAIGFLWKRLNTSSIHLEETHRIVQVMRDVLEEISPGTIIITETNVPHKDNISYFGDGTNEAHMVYQFPLPPLTLNAFMSGNAKHLSEWADSLEPTSDHTTFFNFLASHDGIGLRPVEGILTEEEVQKMVDQVKDNHGYVSYKDNGDGTQSPYELNVNYLSALSKPEDETDQNAARFLAAQMILLSVKGVPGIYIHSLLGSLNDQEGVDETGRYRSINREKLNRDRLESELDENGSLRSMIFDTYLNRIEKRTQESAFHPNAEQEVLFLDDRVFSVIRSNEKSSETITVLVNVSDQQFDVDTEAVQKAVGVENVHDLITESTISLQSSNVELAPYQVMWLKEA
ncbi:sugar phosphorylase [Halobacillus yeomjeoni]|uniref:Sucrose phosphorylase n=1 Tax=Halobacillus yeomjeoni TaxID=311194 RepID=A0A931MUL9_9BACI|nr:sugar phosphorylase [Halobacillus yeomjeoni]MBH0229424.1 sugar phosphorylase [Halobacillus yeomjeoni]